MERFDLVIVGGGILGTNLAYWLSQQYEGKIAVLEAEKEVAFHTSGRNTGVIHRPFYLDPEKRKVFAKSSQMSYALWKKYAALRNLPWKEIGTIEVATRENETETLKKYYKWAVQNGMKESEIELLTPAQVKKLEPNVDCLGAIHSKTDVSVDYKKFTESLKKDSASAGVKFVFNYEVQQIYGFDDGLEIVPKGNYDTIFTKFLINCAGGNSIDIAHLFGAGLEYTDLHFRGEYWTVSPDKSNLASANIYSVPRHADLTFLDPHWIVRADGSREIGPNAVLVAGSKTYKGFFNGIGELLGKIFESPIRNKINLFTNAEFLMLASEEWMSSVSKKKMVKMVQRFIPALKPQDLTGKGTAGVRSSVIDSGGNFIKEAIELATPLSFHIVNYNSPGATGSPAYTAHIVDKLAKNGSLNVLGKRKAPLQSFWNFREIVDKF